MRLLIRWGILTVAFAVTDKLLKHFSVRGGVVNLIIVAAIFGIVNAVIGPFLRLIALPITVLTLGLFALVVNAAVLGIAAALTTRLSIHGFWTGVWAALIISIVSAILGAVFKPKHRQYRQRAR